MMNLFYEEYPDTVDVDGHSLKIKTDFREYISLIDALKDDELSMYDKADVIASKFVDDPTRFDFISVSKALTDFMNRVQLQTMRVSHEGSKKEHKPVFSYSFDFSYILAGFIQYYGIDLDTVDMHWWKFRALFEALPNESEIKQRMYYRGINPATITNKKERKRVMEIQAMIALPESIPDDYEIGDIFS